MTRVVLGIVLLSRYYTEKLGHFFVSILYTVISPSQIIVRVWPPASCFCLLLLSLVARM